MRYRATISFQKAIDEPFSTQKLIGIQNDYQIMIEKCKKIHEKIISNRKNQSNPKMHWELGNQIFLFAKKLEKDDFIFANFTDAMNRDLDLSQTYISKLITFRRYYSSIDLLNEEINWSKYRELLEISNKNFREKCERKIVSGEIKTERQIREFKKMLKTKKSI